MSKENKFHLLRRTAELCAAHEPSDIGSLIESINCFACLPNSVHIAIFYKGEWYTQVQEIPVFDFSTLPSVECS
jgi:hypothetical protein